MKRLTGIILAASLIAPSIAVAQQPVPATSTKVMTVPADAALSNNLIGLNIYDGANNNVGEIKDIVLDKSALKGYILSVGGFLGMGEHYVAVAPSALGIAYNATDKKWRGTINMTKDELKAAPQFKYDGRFGK